jgi:carboxyl-terminal processing protease
LGDGTTALRLTTARYYTPSGRSVQEGGIAPDVPVPQLSDADYRSRTSIRESDLRRHLINEAGIRDDLIQDDGRPDPRFSATAAQLTQRGITDYQLDYAVRTLARLGRTQTAAAAPGRRRASR